MLPMFVMRKFPRIELAFDVEGPLFGQPELKPHIGVEQCIAYEVRLPADMLRPCTTGSLCKEKGEEQKKPNASLHSFLPIIPFSGTVGHPTMSVQEGGEGGGEQPQ